MTTDTRPVPRTPTPPPDTDDLVARLRDRRSAGHVAAAYAAAHGHPLSAHDEGKRRRWSLGTRPGLAALIAVLLLACLTMAVVLVPDWFSAGAVQPLTAAAAPMPEDTAHAEGAGQQRAFTPSGDEAGPTRYSSSATGSDVVTHVVGAVHDPGLVELAGTARVADALEAAGGPTDDADLSGVNLARTVNDGEQIRIPRPGETVMPLPPNAASTGTDVDGTPQTPVDLNTAGAGELETLPGIGPALAAEIIDWRTQNGPFAAVEELEAVPGIGPSILDDISDAARV